MKIICVLGGGSPFTLGLAQAMCRQLDASCGLEVRLLGRDLQRTEHVAAALRRFFDGRPWAVTASVDLEASCKNADVIVHQARIGGHEQRAVDEEFARMAGLSADETMGPAGLRAALRIYEPNRVLAERIHQSNGLAPVLVMANPLAVSTRAFSSVIGDRAIGICEVPLLTEHYLSAPRDAQGVPLFCYVGWNHRGFHWFPEEDDQISGRTSRAVPPPWADYPLLEELRAWPAKQFGELLREGHPIASRAKAVAKIAQELAGEMSRGEIPQSADRRPTPWYDLAVVPAIKAVIERPSWLPATMCFDDDHAQERYVLLGPGGIQARADWTAMPAAVERWHALFTKHQHLVDVAVAQPCAATIAQALAEDPLLPCRDPSIATAIEASLP